MINENTKEKIYALCDKIINAKFILSRQPISALLKYLVSDEEVYALIDKCMQGFHYDKEFNASAVRSQDANTIKLPYNDRKIVAFVLCLLYELDTEKRNISDFLLTYYPDNDINISYQLMTSALIVPFRDSLVTLIDTKDSNNGSNSLTAYADDIPTVAVSDGAITQTEYALRSINAIISEDNSLDQKEKNDYLLLTDGLYYAMESKDIKLIRIVYTGLKYTLMNYKPCAKQLKEVEASLKLYMLI